MAMIKTMKKKVISKRSQYQWKKANPLDQTGSQCEEGEKKKEGLNEIAMPASREKNMKEQSRSDYCNSKREKETASDKLS